MGEAKRWLIEMEQEKLRKQEVLLELPDLLEERSEQVEELKLKMNQLQSEIAKNNSWPEKYKNFIIGGIIGAVISVVFALII